MSNKFPEYNQLNLSDINKKMLKEWDAKQVFQKSLETRKDAPTFVFYEGPPSANGMPGIHHVMARAIKDIFCRYKTMKGFLVNRKAGWDTHGLPIELSVEKTLGITKEDIGKKISIAEYNAACRTEVMKYTKEWEDLTEKMGYWVDMSDPYITYDSRYIETLWYLLKEMYKKDFLYKGYSIQPYSPAAGTGLSSHELNQPGCYRDVKDTTCVVQFHLPLTPSKGGGTAAERNYEHLQKLHTGDSLSFGKGRGEVYFLAWTTTPWTLPSNTALCVGGNIDYVKIKTQNPYTKTDVYLILAEALLEKVLGKNEYEIVAKYKGNELVGLEYKQLIPWINPGEGAFRVISDDFVTTEDGTGIVHIAPTFGADDARVAKNFGVPALVVIDKNGNQRPLVDLQGKFYKIEDLDDSFVAKSVNVDLYKTFAGRFVKNEFDPNYSENTDSLDVDLCVMLKGKGLAYKIEKYTHNYPHCWRTDKPILYYPLDSWFIRATAVKERMIELNNTINWKPQSTGTGRFGKWLENLNDWNLSRSRYWGTPLPIWRTEDGKEEKCIGSVKELVDEMRKAVEAGVMTKLPWADFDLNNYQDLEYDKIDLHRPYVDDIVLVSDSGKPMKRELDLIDVWFDSGAMPFAQVFYPHINENEFQKIYPADFIAEGVDQTRGWFYTLHAISTMVKDSVAFKNVISNGLVLDKNGNKMSKSKGNAIDPFATIEKYGSDPLRWYMITNASPWDNLKFDIDGVEETRRKFFGTLYNTYSFFTLYANVDDFTNQFPQIAIEKRPEIDRWIISLLNSLVKEVDTAYEAYEPTKAGRAIADFVNDNLSNWYVRLNRKRFWGGEMTDDKLSAYQTLFECLVTVAKLMSPIAPFYADKLFLDLTPQPPKGGLQSPSISVHLEDFPVCNEMLIDKNLEECMQLAQQTSSMILALRRKADKKVRQPLTKAVVPAQDEKMRQQLQYVADLIKTEVNVKEFDVLSPDAEPENLVKKIKPNFKTLGKKYGKQMKEIAAEMANFNKSQISEIERTGEYTLPLASGDVMLTAEDVEIYTEDIPGWLVANEGRLTVALDITITDELRKEGIARELVNRIQNLRKAKDFEITDRIIIQLSSNPLFDEAITDFADYVKGQVLADEIKIVNETLEDEIDIDDVKLTVSVKKA